MKKPASCSFELGARATVTARGLLLSVASCQCGEQTQRNAGQRHLPLAVYMPVKETGKEVSALVSLAAVTKYRRTGSLNRTLIAHSPGDQEAQDQCAGQFGFW